MKDRVDVTVVGAGPAGLAVAIGAASCGMRVRVVEVARHGPVDKACGEGLLPDALSGLDRLGVRVGMGHRFVGIRFCAELRVAEARFATGVGVGLRRIELHRAMLDRAEQLGITVEWGVRLQELDDERDGFIVGADGSQSLVRTWAGLTDEQVTSRRIGLRQHFAVDPWSEFVEVYWGSEIQAYVTPVGTCEVGVALVSRRKVSMDEGLERFPALRERLAGAEPTSTARGAATVTRRLQRVTTGRVALVGDASGSVDAITGEGMSLCFRQAEVLVSAIASGALVAYERAHPTLMRMARVMSGALLLMDRSVVVRQGAMAVLTAVPDVFETLLQMHVARERRKDEPVRRLPLALPGRLER